MSSRSRRSETAYTAEQFGQIKAAATRSFHPAWRRITGNQRHLQEWRAGRFEEQSMPWLLGEALERLAVTGDVPTRRYGPGQCRMPDPRYLQALGGGTAEHTWQRLFLPPPSGVAGRADGDRLRLELHPGVGARPSRRRGSRRRRPESRGRHRVELEKRRRHPPHRYETRNLADWGPNAPGRLITRAIEATGPARIPC